MENPTPPESTPSQPKRPKRAAPAEPSQQPEQPTLPLESDKTTRLWGAFCHIVALAGFIIPFGNLIGPLILWLLRREDIPFVDDQGKESLNFQITVTIAMLICFLLSFIVIGIPLLVAVIIYNVIMIIIATVKANNGEHYRYPITLRLVK
jgi:uncharacterized Tic20 family protein